MTRERARARSESEGSCPDLRTAPQPNGGADGGVEGAVGFCGNLVGGGEHGEEIGANGDGRTAGAVGKAVEFAASLVVAHDRVELVDAVKSGRGR